MVDIIVVFSEGVAAITEPSLLRIIDLLISRKKLSGLGVFLIPTSSNSLTPVSYTHLTLPTTPYV